MKKKNILLVSFDDAVAPWPYKSVFQEPLQTPNLDRLCDVSTAFHSAYSQAPICGPSRASMMTTMMPHELGIVDNKIFIFDHIAPEMVWSYRLKESGYFCSSGGKVHHRYKPLGPGAHKVLYSDERKQFSDDMKLPREIRKRARGYGGHRNGRGTQDGVDDGFYYDKQVADSAIDFLNKYNGEAPFYREVGFFSPHAPHVTPARFKEMYNASNLAPPQEWRRSINNIPYVAQKYPERKELESERWWQQSIRNYFSAFSHGDFHLGRVVDALKASHHAENTIIVVISDHGFHLGNRNLFQKSTLWEQSLRVPFIIFDPTEPRGREIDDPVALIDLGPTILDFADLPAPERRHGRSLRPFLYGHPDPDRTIPSFFRGNSSVRKGDYRIIRYEDGSCQLFDLSRDFWNLNDLGAEHEMFSPMFRALKNTSEECGLVFQE